MPIATGTLIVAGEQAPKSTPTRGFRFARTGALMATPLENVDRELRKLAAVLHDAIMREDHGRQKVLWADVNDMLDRRLLLRSASV